MSADSSDQDSLLKTGQLPAWSDEVPIAAAQVCSAVLVTLSPDPMCVEGLGSDPIAVRGHSNVHTWIFVYGTQQMAT